MSQYSDQPAPIQVIHNAYTPKEAVEICSRAGTYKAKMRIDKIIISAFMAGALLSFAVCKTDSHHPDQESKSSNT